MTGYEVIVAGLVTVDLIPTFLHSSHVPLAEMVRPGKLNHVGPLQFSTGGAVSNTGIALIKLGAKTRLMGKVGDDYLGTVAVSILGRYVPEADRMVRKGEQTSYTIVMSPASTDRVFFHYPGCNDTFTAADVDQAAVAGAKVFHFGYPPLMKTMYANQGEELVRLVKKAKECGLTVSLDLAMPDPHSEALKADWPLIFRRVLPYVDVFLPSLEEALLLWDPAAYKDFDSLNPQKREEHIPSLAVKLAGDFLDLGASIVGIKCGVLGYHVQTKAALSAAKLGLGAPADLNNWAGRKLFCASYKPETFASATGAGDCSIAGFLMAMLRGCTLEETVNAACAVGAQNVRKLDATAGVEDWEYTLQMMRRPWERLFLPLDEAWTYDPVGKVWVEK